jgi:hypothetical protein
VAGLEQAASEPPGTAVKAPPIAVALAPQAESAEKEARAFI